MNGLALGVLLLVVPGCCRGQPLDKTGTTGPRTGVAGSQTPKKKEPASAGSFAAERAGFSDRGLYAGPEGSNSCEL